MPIHEIIVERIARHQLTTPEETEGALKEALQEIILFGLATAGFFDIAAFQGGTSLRIAHQLPRFSEELDFVLHQPDPTFRWAKWADAITTTCQRFGITPTLTDRSQAGKAVQAMWLKDDSLGLLLDLSWRDQNRRKLRIKLEIDTEPPKGVVCRRHFLDFPVTHAVEVWDLPSNFAGKLHALLCRPYVKGRDWFDFAWYVQRRVEPNLALLQSALDQHGPWAGQSLEINGQWLISALTQKIGSIDWAKAKMDVAPFVQTLHKQGLDVWEAAYFIQRVEQLEGYIGA